jgi:protein-disulfide isomerase
MQAYKDLYIPGAILLAGLFIGGTILYSGGGIVPPGSGAAGVVSLDQKGNVLLEAAKSVGVNEDRFVKCVEERTYQTKVQEHTKEGVGLGVQGTPGSFVNGTLVSGAIPYDQNSPGYRPGGETLKQIIEAALAGTTGDAKVEVGQNDHIRGNVEAPVTLVEFSDLQCPFCARFHGTVRQALADYGPDIRWVYKHFPLEAIHPVAIPAAEASECVWEQKGDEGFWQFVDVVFENQSSL